MILSENARGFLGSTIRRGAGAWFALLLACPWAAGEEFTIIKQNGGWCWFENERAIVDDDRVIVGTVSSPEGHIEVTSYHLQTKKIQSARLHENLQSDDHNSPALLRLPDGRYLASYSTHGGDRSIRWRVTERPGDITAWRPEQAIDVGERTTYSNLLRLSEEGGIIYNFHRAIGWDPNYLMSRDEGRTWAYGGRLLDGEGRPYVIYTTNHRDAIHFVTTEQHPHVFANSVYHGFIRERTVYRSDGTRVAELPDNATSPIGPADLTPVFKGDEQNVAWTIDLQLDREGRPYTVFSVHKTDEDHRYHYAQWNGERWEEEEIAYAGSCLYPAEYHYTGLAALDPGDPQRVFISTDVDPLTGSPLVSRTDGKRHYELFQGTRSTNGGDWTWVALTRDSTVDHIRPVVPEDSKNRTVLLWLRGEYRSYVDYDLDVAAAVIDESIGGDP